MNEVLINLSLIGIIVFQQVFFMRQVQKLLDKAMSRSFTEYKSAEAPVPRPKITEDYGPVEDLGSLDELKTF